MERSLVRATLMPRLLTIALLIFFLSRFIPHLAVEEARAVQAVPPVTKNALALSTDNYPVFVIAAENDSGDVASGTVFYLQRPSGRWMITANHVIDDANPGKIAARIGKTWLRLRIGRQDRGADLAALLAEGSVPSSPLLLRATSAQQGELVFILGFPIPDVLGIASPTTVQGRVTGYSTTPGAIPGFFVAAPAGPGNSGGPVLDNGGAVVGIVIYASRDGSLAYAEHGFQILKLLGEFRY